MSQLELDKTAEEFRRTHEQRQADMLRWNEAAKIVADRDKQLIVMHQK